MEAHGYPASWKGDRLYLGTRQSGYSVVQDVHYSSMWRVRRPDGRLSDMVNRTRAKDAALAMLDRDLRRRETAAEAPLVAQNGSTLAG
jgi:hypothetical protein